METSNNLLDQDWYSLFGKEFQEPIFQEIITQQPGKKFEHKVFKDNAGTHEYYFNYDLGVSLSFNNGIFSSIFIYGKFDKKFTACTGKLPYFLNFDMNNADIVSFLGEPNKKQGGRTVPISLTYERLGIEFTFISPIWDITDNKLNFICLFPKNKDSDLVICALDRKNASSFCSQCKTVAYCSLACQTAHWKVHKIHCNKYFKNKPS